MSFNKYLNLFFTILAVVGGFTDSNLLSQCVNGPVANFNFTGGNNQCANLPKTFTNTSTGTNLTYNWSFGNPASGINNTSTAINPIHEFISTGGVTEDFIVQLIAIDANGCRDTILQTITVRQSPGANLIDPSNGFRNCDGSAFNMNVFDITPTLPPDVTNYTIKWGDGGADFNSASFPPGGVPHTYGTVEVFNLLYIVSGANGCNDSLELSVGNITNPSIGAANPGGTTGCAPLNICFPLSNFAANHPTTIYLVDFGDGTPVDTLSHPPPNELCHSYVTPSCGGPGGSYSFSVTAVNFCDESVASINPIRVFIAPIASFAAPATACAGVPTVLTNTSTPGFNNTCSAFATVNWDFGDGTSLPMFNLGPVTHTYANPGTYDVVLSTTNSCGTTTSTQQICVESPPTPNFTVDNSSGCIPLDVATDNTSTTSNDCSTNYSWSTQFLATSCNPTSGANSFTNGTTSADFEPTFLFSGPGEYRIQLTMSNSCGNFTANQTIIAQAPPDISLNPVSSICGGQSISPTANINDCLEPIDNFAWSFPGASTTSASTLNPGSITYPTNGPYTISLTATNACGSDIATTSLTVNSVPPVLNPFTASPLCAGYDAIFTSDNVPNATYNWTGPNGFTSGLQNPTIFNATALNAGTYTVFASFGTCAGASQTVDLSILPITVVTAGNDIELCIDEAPFTLNTGLPIGGTWSGPGITAGVFDASLAGAGNHTLTYSFTDPITNCTYTDDLIATINSLPIVDAGVDLSLCNQPIANTLTPITPLNGTWSGPGVAAGEFTPSTNGDFEVLYSFTDLNGCFNEDTILVSVIDPVDGDAGLDSIICVNGGDIQLSGLPVGGTWTGTGISGNGLYTPTIDGTFTMTYTFGAGTCQTSDEMDFIVNPAPVVDAGNDFDICLDGGIVDLSSTPTPLGGTWSGDGVTNSSGDFDPMTSGIGNHTLTYTYTDPITNCSNTSTLVATVNALPVVNAGNDTTLCNQPVAVQFIGSPLGGTWSGNAITAGGSYTPTGVGQFKFFYEFFLGTCSITDSMIVTVIDATIPDAGVDLELCFSDTQTQLVGAPIGGTWTGVGIAGNGNFTPNIPDTYEMVYTLGAGNCLLRDTMELIVHSLPIVEAGSDDEFCESESAVNFIGSPAGGNWTGTGITNGTFGTFDPSAANAGSNILTYTFTDLLTNCTNFDSIDVIINELPIVDFSYNPIICVGVTENFTNNSTNAVSYTWDFDDNLGLDLNIDPTHTYSNFGFYDIELIATSLAGCRDSLTQTVEVRELPNIDFTLAPDSACGPLNVTFTNNTTGIGALVFAWDFGNGQISGAQNPLAVTYQAGVLSDTIYQVNLDVTNFCGTVSQTKPVKVMPSPLAIFGPQFDINCSPIVEIANNSIGLPDSYQWDFGDGTTGTESDALFTHFFAQGINDTSYVVQLIVTNECGSDTAYHTITILPNTVNSFFNTDFTQGCSPLEVNFTNLSSGSQASNWDFGDNNFSSGVNANHTFTQAGTYTVQLIVNDQCNKDTSYATITVLPPPAIDFTFTPNIACEGTNFQFTNESLNVNNLSWDFGDNTTSNLTDPGHIFSSSGTFPVTLTGASIINNCVSTRTRNVVVSPRPVSDFNMSATSGCSPATIIFTNTSSGSNFTTWDFGDNNSSSQVSVSHVFNAAGTFEVSLISETIVGCKDTLKQSIQIFPTPNAEFEVQVFNECNLPVNASMINNSTDATQYLWDFGNNSTSNLLSPSTIYTAPANYDIKLVVQNQFGCRDSITKPINIAGIPIADFAVPPYDTCVSSLVAFANSSQNAAFVSWNFGDGNFSTQSNPIHNYTVAGNYNVKLVVENSVGCKDSMTMLVRVFPLPVASFTLVNNTPCQVPANVSAFNTSIGSTNNVWNFGNNFNSNLTSPSTNYEAPGTYFIKLVTSNQYGCADSTIQEITIYPPPAANFVLTNQNICIGETFNGTNLSTQADSIKWYMGDGTTYTTNTFTHEYQNPGQYTVSLIAYGQGNCSDSLSSNQPVIVNTTPIADFTYSNVETENQVTGIIDFINLSSNANSYLWSLDTDTTTFAVNPSYHYNSYGEFAVTLLAVNNNGCTDEITKLIKVDFFKGLFIPNAFSPGNPNFEVANFIPVGVGLFSYHIYIYDDWGNLIWESTALDINGRPTEYWDGRFNGVPVQQDAYVWKVEASYINSELWEGKTYPKGKIKRAGTVTVIR